MKAAVVHPNTRDFDRAFYRGSRAPTKREHESGGERGAIVARA